MGASDERYVAPCQLGRSPPTRENSGRSLILQSYKMDTREDLQSTSHRDQRMGDRGHNLNSEVEGNQFDSGSTLEQYSFYHDVYNRDAWESFYYEDGQFIYNGGGISESGKVVNLDSEEMEIVVEAFNYNVSSLLRYNIGLPYWRTNHRYAEVLGVARRMHSFNARKDMMLHRPHYCTRWYRREPMEGYHRGYIPFKMDNHETLEVMICLYVMNGRQGVLYVRLTDNYMQVTCTYEFKTSTLRWGYHLGGPLVICRACTQHEQKAIVEWCCTLCRRRDKAGIRSWCTCGVPATRLTQGTCGACADCNLQDFTLPDRIPNDCANPHDDIEREPNDLYNPQGMRNVLPMYQCRKNVIDLPVCGYLGDNLIVVDQEDKNFYFINSSGKFMLSPVGYFSFNCECSKRYPRPNFKKGVVNSPPIVARTYSELVSKYSIPLVTSFPDSWIIKAPHPNFMWFNDVFKHCLPNKITRAPRPTLFAKYLDGQASTSQFYRRMIISALESSVPVQGSVKDFTFDMRWNFVPTLGSYSMKYLAFMWQGNSIALIEPHKVHILDGPWEPVSMRASDALAWDVENVIIGRLIPTSPDRARMN